MVVLQFCHAVVWDLRTAGIFARNGNLDTGSRHIWEMGYWVGWLFPCFCCFGPKGLDSPVDLSFIFYTRYLSSSSFLFMRIAFYSIERVGVEGWWGRSLF